MISLKYHYEAVHIVPVGQSAFSPQPHLPDSSSHVEPVEDPTQSVSVQHGVTHLLFSQISPLRQSELRMHTQNFSVESPIGRTYYFLLVYPFVTGNTEFKFSFDKMKPVSWLFYFIMADSEALTLVAFAFNFGATSGLTLL